jgi:polysaccharide pyruvyl transferase WcaK-like protein
MFNTQGSVLINLRPWKMSPSTRKDIDITVKKFGSVFVPFSEDDIHCNPGLPLREIATDFIYDKKQTLSCSALICMRFHACVWAILQGIPFFALVYDDKVLSLAKQMKQSWVDIRECRTNAPLLTQCSDFFDNLETYYSHIIQQRMFLISEAENHTDVFHG